MDDSRGDICAGRHGGAATSVEAFSKTRQSYRSKQRNLVKAFIFASGTAGATCEEVAVGLEIPYTAASARISQLRKDDEIHSKPGERRLTTHGRASRVHLGGPRPAGQRADE